MENVELLSSENNSGAGDNFSVDELLHFSDTDEGEHTLVVGAADFNVGSSNSSFSGEEYPFHGENVFRSTVDPQLSADLCIPHEDIVALEWLSNFVEDSFSSKGLPNMDLIKGTKTPLKAISESCSSKTEPDQDLTHLQPEPHLVITTRNPKTEPDPDLTHLQPEPHLATTHSSQVKHEPDHTLHPKPPIPGKSRTKRPRTTPCDWASRLSILSPTTHVPSPLLSDPPLNNASDEPLEWREWPMDRNIASTDQPIRFAIEKTPHAQPGPITIKTDFDDHPYPFPNDKIAQPRPLIPKTPSNNNSSQKKKREVVAGVDGRRCLHCDTDKTPQWRTGPLGPKTLCNACGVRFKSGRLVPEYRPAASPTFVTTKHSNSHRKVIELRRQKETINTRVSHRMFDQVGGTVMFDGLIDGDDYLIHHPMGHDFGHMV